jgi:hypothetical protein
MKTWKILKKKEVSVKGNRKTPAIRIPLMTKSLMQVVKKLGNRILKRVVRTSGLE